MGRYFDSHEDFWNTRLGRPSKWVGLRKSVHSNFPQAWKRFSARAAERTAEVKKRGCVNSCKKVWKQSSQETGESWGNLRKPVLWLKDFQNSSPENHVCFPPVHASSDQV